MLSFIYDRIDLYYYQLLELQLAWTLQLSASQSTIFLTNASNDFLISYFFLVACYATLHPTVSVRRYVPFLLFRRS